jgi:hypothetical protein
VASPFLTGPGGLKVLPLGTPAPRGYGRTHFADEVDDLEASVSLADELARDGRSSEAVSMLEAFLTVYPERRDEFEDSVCTVPALCELWSRR